MQLLMMRHGEAGFEQSVDEQRRLTDLGQREVLHMGSKLAPWFTECQLVLVSPYVRAQQTLTCLTSYLPESAQVVMLPELTPESNPELSHDVIAAHCELSQAKRVLVIAHMPLLAYLVREFVPGQEPPLFATAAVASIELSDAGHKLTGMHAPAFTEVL